MSVAVQTDKHLFLVPTTDNAVATWVQQKHPVNDYL